MRIVNKKQIKITKEELINIYGDDYHFFEEKIIPNCFCSNCKSPYNSTIVNYEIFLHSTNDIVLKGFCKKCGNSVNRYLEMSEVEKYNEAINKLRKKLLIN